MKPSGKRIIYLLIAASILLFCNCKYMVYETSAVSLPTGSTIGILVDLPWGGQSSNNDLTTFMSTALVKRGYVVKSINPSDLIPQSIAGSIYSRVDEKYAFMEEFVKMIATNKAKISGNKEFWQSLMEVNETKESTMRFFDLNNLVDDFIKRWNTDYIMFITPYIDIKGVVKTELLVRIVEIKNREVIFASYFKFDNFKFNKKVPNPKIARSKASSLRRDNTYKMIKMCEYLSSKLQAKGAK